MVALNVCIPLLCVDAQAWPARLVPARATLRAECSPLAFGRRLNPNPSERLDDVERDCFGHCLPLFLALHLSHSPREMSIPRVPRRDGNRLQRRYSLLCRWN